MQKLVLVGGGHSHAIALRRFRHRPLIDTQITLITDVLQAPYSGMLPGHIAGFYSFQECHIDLSKLAKAGNINIILAKVLGLDLDNQRVICDNSQIIAYDILSINIGSTPNLHGISGADVYGSAVKPIPAFLTAWQQLLQEWEDSQGRQEKLTITIVGGGAGGVELALNMQERLANIYLQYNLQQDSLLHDNRISNKTLNHEQFTADKKLDKLRSKLTINLLHRQLELLPQYSAGVGKYIRKLLSDRQINLYLGESVDQIFPKKSHDDDLFSQDLESYDLSCVSGLKISSDRVFWVTNATAPSWLKSSGLATNQGGFVVVNNYLQSISHPQIFAVGDIASMVNYPLPKAGVFAVRQGLPLAENLRLFRTGQTLKPYRPQSRYLGLIGTGDRHAVAVYGRFGLAGIGGGWLGAWKDRIDRQFMAQFGS